MFRPVLLIFQLYIYFTLLDLISCRNQQNKNAREDSFLTVPQLITKYGYPVEVHEVVTTDGYILGIHRIPHGKKSPGKPGKGKAVLLNHGIWCSSADWIITGPENGLGYILADAGYDVWMMNDRGNTYSKNHTHLSTKSSAFWNFDWHEIGIYDIPATIDHILQTTNNEKLTYIGFSQGTTSFLVFASLLPEYNQKIQLKIGLGPVAFLQRSKDVILNPLLVANQPIFTSLRLLFGIKDYFPTSEIRTKFTNAVCDKNDLFQPLCMWISTLFQSTSNLNKDTYVAIQGHYPAGASYKQWEHAGQIFNSGRFRPYDYGWIHNKKIYHRFTPPDYPLGKISAPVVLIGGAKDLLGTKENIDQLVKVLPNVVERRQVSDPKFSHFDFVWGMDAKDVVYEFVLEKIQQFSDNI